MDSPVFELVCGAQSYDWGKLGKDGSKVAQFARGLPGFAYDEEKPYAELWMGTHPSCPSTLLKTGESLKEYLHHRPQLLGPKVLAKFGTDLPFLFKVLAIRKALSIQAHPDKQLARRLHDEKPDIYKDANHKPEMALALTDFSGFCGFRPPTQIAQFLRTVPELAGLVGKDLSDRFPSTFSKQACQTETRDGLKELFSSLMNADAEAVATACTALVSRMAKGSGEEGREERELIEVLNRDFKGDVGIFCTFLLNVVHLKPGEAVFLKANEPHAYLDGDIMECMATSDNVVRAGLTPKLRDVPTLTSMLTYTASPPSEQLLPPAPYAATQHTKLYDPPIEEFSVLLTRLASGETEHFAGIDGPSILIFTELGGEATLRFDGAEQKIARAGQVFFIGAGVAVDLAATQGATTCYRAFVVVEDE